MIEERELEKKLNEDVIAFNRGRVLIANPKEKLDDTDLFSERMLLLLSFTDQLKIFGFTLSSEVLKSITTEEVKRVYKNLIPYLVEKYHSGEEFKPVYPYFPDQVISKSHAELWSDQNKLYNGEEIDVDNWYEEIDAEEKEVKYKELKLMTVEEFDKIPVQIMSSNNSLSLQSKAELLWFLDNRSVNIPERIPFKETLCLVLSTGKQIDNLEINDVLRYSFYIMGTDPSLPNVPKKRILGLKVIDNPEWRNLKSLSRSKRREICGLIEEVIKKKGWKNIITDTKHFYGHWLLLSERLHPGDFSKYYPYCWNFFSTIKDSKLIKNYRTWQSNVQKMYDEKKPLVSIAKKISERPGELVRRFDSLIRRAIKDNDESEIMDVFIETEGMKNKTLLELSDYYDKRGKLKRLVKKTDGSYFTLDDLEPFNPEMSEVIGDVICRKVLINIKSRIKEKDLEGKTIFLDPEIKRIPIPKSMRNSNYEIPTGTKIKIPEDKEVVRFFVHWIDKEGREDLDLHAFYIDSAGNDENVGWNSRFKVGSSAIVFSGDVRQRQGKCAEYVDVDLKQAYDEGVRYIVSDVYNYEGRDFTDLDCWLGFCYRDKITKPNTLWSPDEVEQMVEINSKHTGIAAYLIDLEKREIILVNCAMNSITNGQDNASYQKRLVDYFTTEVNNKFNSYVVLKASYEARGAKVIDQLPPKSDNDEDDQEKEEIIEVSFEDISKDYTKVLEAIGE